MRLRFKRTARAALLVLLGIFLLVLYMQPAFAAEVESNADTHISEVGSATDVQLTTEMGSATDVQLTTEMGSATDAQPATEIGSATDVQPATEMGSATGEALSGTEKRVTIMLTGDLMCQPMQQHAAYNGVTYDFTDTFKYVKKIFDKADFVVGNLETQVSKTLPLSKDISSLDGKPYLNSPPQFLDALKSAGYDALVTGNNHACDGGEIGIRETLEQLDQRGFEHTGTFNDKTDKRYIILEKDGIKIGVVSYGVYFNLKDKFLSNEQRSIMINRLTKDKVLKDVADMKADGAEYIIAYNHCGVEYSQVSSGRQEIYAIMLANCGVDYVIGSHPHVLQEYSVVTSKDGKKVPVIYSMGNFTSSMSVDATKETIILSLELVRSPEGQVVLSQENYFPCYMMDYYQGSRFVLVPADSKYNDGQISQKLKKAFEHIKKIIGKKLSPNS